MRRIPEGVQLGAVFKDIGVVENDSGQPTTLSGRQDGEDIRPRKTSSDPAEMYLGRDRHAVKSGSCTAVFCWFRRSVDPYRMKAKHPVELIRADRQALSFSTCQQFDENRLPYHRRLPSATSSRLGSGAAAEVLAAHSIKISSPSVTSLIKADPRHEFAVRLQQFRCRRLLRALTANWRHVRRSHHHIGLPCRLLLVPYGY